LIGKGKNMKHESDENYLVIKETDVNFETWVNKKFITDNIRQQLSNKDVLIVPSEGFRDLKFPVFPVKTEEVFNFLKKEFPKDVSVDICIEDKDYKEVALHADLVIISTFIVTSVALPVLINVLSSYISKKLFKPESANVRVAITAVKKDGNAFNIEYEGPAKEFSSISEKTKELVE
jgi:hypothetical protein